MSIGLCFHGELNVGMDVVEVVEEGLQVHGARSRMCHPRNGINMQAFRLSHCLPPSQSLQRRSW
jgi:hypothetical protein